MSQNVDTYCLDLEKDSCQIEAFFCQFPQNKEWRQMCQDPVLRAVMAAEFTRGIVSGALEYFKREN